MMVGGSSSTFHYAMSLTTYAADLPPSDNNPHFVGEDTTAVTDTQSDRPRIRR
ncbi:hypothetical protein Rhow_000871 [Rhodococcus wratislaviensis]|uniref:Uncharacterized protein n=1 Tax=Rhodococcus wratislaviensis TaxID=44752 RepID=A0A402C335_RHOWR|nr:hypothetical protein Rhow_000871 [Rhodococcus wratislaviensis]